jgi:hypothetical protein
MRTARARNHMRGIAHQAPLERLVITEKLGSQGHGEQPLLSFLAIVH